MDITPDDDPWNWSIDNVVHAFCTSRQLWAGRPDSALPQPQALEKILRDQCINGSTLLDHVNDATLKGDFNIPQVGQRSAILYAIELLRNQSLQYNSRKRTLVRRSSTRDDLEDRPITPALTGGRTREHSVIETSSASHHEAPSSAVQLVGNIFDQPPIETPIARPGEIIVIDENSRRKRRKLNISASIDNSVPTTVASKVNHGDYFGVPKLSLDGLFFDSTVHGTSEYEKASSTMLEDDFDFAYPKANEGRQIFVSRRLRHYMLQLDQEVDESTRVIYPYPERLVNDGHCQNTLLFRSVDGSVQTQKRDAVMVKSNLLIEDDEADNHEFDYLRKWANLSRDEEIPVWKDSDDESEVDEVTAAEMKKDAEEDRIPKRRQNVLSDGEVAEIIDESINAFVEKWNAELPSRQWKAWMIWKKAKGRQSKTVLTATQRVHELNARLNVMRKTLRGESWKHRNQIKRQSRCMEQTVFDRELHLWKIRILNGCDPPQRPPIKPSRRKLSPVSDEEDCEVLDSNSELSDYLSSNDDLQSNERAKARRSGAFTDVDLDLSNGPEEGPKVSHLTPTSTSEISPKAIDLIQGSPDSNYSKDSVLGSVKKYTALEDDVDIIDLTVSSPEELLEESFSNAPELEPIETILRYSTIALEERNDRKRLVLKIFLEKISPRLQKEITGRIETTKFSHIADEITRGLGAIKQNTKYLNGHDPSVQDAIYALSVLYFCWYLCRDVFDKPTDIPEIDQALKAEPKAQRAEQIKPFIMLFEDFMDAQSKYIDNPTPNLSGTPRKQRKGLVKRSKHSLNLQMVAKERKKKAEERTRQLVEQVGPKAVSEHTEGVIINVNKQDDEDLIYMNPHIGSKIKQHQIDGVRFMWRELIAGNLEDQPGQGCLLAHTMGLGKTMQTIALLVTIAEASKSKNPRISKQVPHNLDVSRILILCPPGLIENWIEELKLWIPPNTASIGPITTVTASDQLAQRLESISHWHDQQGVLVMGYAMFKQIINNNGPTSIPHSVTAQLLQGPSIVVADEAHMLKNRTSMVSVATAKFRTHSRIALTGSPLANNLSDYFSMIDWIAPSFLGCPVEFKAHYQEPIEHGFYVESTRFERRNALKKLRVLEVVLQPKVHRAGIEVLKGSLKPKLEFVIIIPLTKLQEEAYRIFVRLLASETYIANTRLWAWMRNLELLCNHPRNFLPKLEENKKRAVQIFAEPIQNNRTSTPIPDEIGTEVGMLAITETEKTRELKISDAMFQQQKELFSRYDNLDAIELSNKVIIIVKILEEAKLIGDKTLLFSHSIPTLNYLETVLIRRTFRYKRLDGSSKMAERVDMAKKFNQGSYHVFLISTQAGGLGINLQGANRVILMDFQFNPTWEEQAVGRAYRIGQQKPVFVYRFVTGGTFEERVHNRAMFKTQLSYRVVDKKKPEVFASRARDYLFEPKPVPQADVEDAKGKDTIMDVILGDEKCQVRGVSTTETLHREMNEDLTEEEMKEVELMQIEENLRTSNRGEWEKRQVQRQMLAMRGATGW